MNNFKGTKGKGEAVENGYVWEIVVCDINKKSICAVNNTLKEVNANALLISKAPEMLEMLQKVSYALFELHQSDDSSYIFDIIDAEKLDKLIKEATEL